METTKTDIQHRDVGTLPAMLRAAVRSNPARLALIAGDASLTYAELWTRATAQAAHLRRSGVGPGASVGLFLEPSMELVVAVWGVLLAGAAYVPLAVDYPAERIRYMVSRSRLAHIISDERSAPVVRKLTPETVRIHTSVGTGALPSDEDHSDEAHPAYIIFTSGSTGKPKGVVISHASITHQMRWLADEMDLGQARILLKTPTSFDAAQWELLTNSVGGTIVVGANGTHRDPSRIVELVETFRVTHLQCVPTLWRALTRQPTLARCYALTHLFSGGEALTPADAHALMMTAPWAQLINLYGPTETTINATFHRVCSEDLNDTRSGIPIGRPVPGCSIYVLDDTHQMTTSIAGELAIGGPQVASGYVNDPELTVVPRDVV